MSPKPEADINQARLRPHLRLGSTQASITEVYHADRAVTISKPTNRIVTPSPGDLRGIPVIGHGGAIRGTAPGTNL